MAENWNTTTETGNFFYLKGIIEQIFQKLGIGSLNYKESKSDSLSEGLQISHKKNKLVEFGVVKKAILKKFNIDQEVLFADFNWQAVLEVAKNQKVKVEAIPRYPVMRRDFALLLDESVTYSEIEEIALKTEKKLLKNVNLFDVYEGNNLPKGKKSYAVSFLFQDEHKTLTDKQVDKMMNKLQQKFEQELKAELR